MTNPELLAILKDVVVQNIRASNPGDAQELGKLRNLVDASVTVDSPIASLGWDSLQMTWLLVAIEDRLEIDTSNLSLFELHSIDDLLNELQILRRERETAGND